MNGEETVGYLLGFEHLTFYANGPVGWVEEVFVRGQDRGRGAGRALMSAFEQWAAVRDCALIALATRRAAPFYRALGYEESAAYFRKILDSTAPPVSFSIEDSVAHAANLRRGIYVGKLQPAWRPFCRFLAVSG